MERDRTGSQKILLTASGGPFRGEKRAELAYVTLEDALKHQTGAWEEKITVDSATLVNKGLEVMEAKWLFDVKLEQIQVVVHPQSVIHSMRWNTRMGQSSYDLVRRICVCRSSMHFIIRTEEV